MSLIMNVISEMTTLNDYSKRYSTLLLPVLAKMTFTPSAATSILIPFKNYVHFRLPGIMNNQDGILVIGGLNPTPADPEVVTIDDEERDDDDIRIEHEQINVPANESIFLRVRLLSFKIIFSK